MESFCKHLVYINFAADSDLNLSLGFDWVILTHEYQNWQTIYFMANFLMKFDCTRFSLCYEIKNECCMPIF